MNKTLTKITSLLFAVTLLAGCAPATEQSGAATDAPAESNGAAPTQAAPGEPVTISISGAFALFPLATVWADEYSALYPNVTFDVQAGGAGKGMTDLLGGAVDIAMLSRAAKPEEEAQGVFLVPTTIDAVIPTVNANNPVLDQLLATGITPENAGKVFLTQEITTWGQLLDTDNADGITVYTRSDSAGAAEVWALFAGGKGTTQEDLKGTAVNGDPGLAEAVRQDPLAFGFNNNSFAYDPTTGQQLDGLRVVPLDLNGNGTITPDEDFYGTRADLAAAIASRTFPFPPARELYLVTKGKPSPAVAAFLKWVVTDGQKFVAEAGFISLDQETLDAALASLEE